MSNGFVVYPSGRAAANIAVAHEIAREDSQSGDYVSRIEDCDDEQVIARYRNGVEVSR